MPRPNEDELKKKLGTASAAPAAQAGPAKSTASASTYTPAKKPVVALPKKTGTTSAELLKRAAPYMASKVAARSVPDFIASQPGVDKWYANEAPTTPEMFGRIYTVTENDENRRGELLGMFETEMNSTASPYYNPYYMRGTSQAVSALEALGFQFSGDITRQTVDELRQFGDYSNYGVSGSLLAPSGKSTEAQNVAYWTNKLADAVDESDRIDTEWDNLVQNVTYWTQLGYSDEEVLAKIDWSEYSALTGLDEGRERRTPVQTARATPYSRDTLYGVMWAARNGGGSGDYMADAAQYAMGRGNAYRRDAAAEAARDPSSQAYNPYTRCTMDEARMYFGQSEFDAKWLEDNRALLASGDAVAAKLWQRVYDAQQTTDAALAELEALEVVVGRYSERGMASDKILARIDLEKDYPTLYRMEQARLRGDALALTRPVGFTMPYFTDWVEEVARPELVEDTWAETPMPKSIPDAPSGIMSEYWGWLDPPDTAGISESAKPEGPGPTRPPSPDPTQAPQGEKPAADLRPSAAPPPSANAQPEPQAASARTFKYWDWLGSQIGTEVEQPASESAAMLAGESANQYDPLTDRAEGTVFTWAAFDQSAQHRAGVSDISARQFNGELLQSSVDFVNGNGDGNGWTDKYSELLNDIAQGSMFITSVNRGFSASGAAFGGDYMASEDTALSATSLALGKKAYEILKTAHDSPYITQEEYVQLAMMLTRHLETAESSGMTLEEYYGANETASAELDMTGQQIKWHEEQAKQAQELDIMRQQQKYNEYISFMHEAFPAFVSAMNDGTATQEQAEFVSFVRSIDAGAVGGSDDLYNTMRGEIGRISEWEQILPGGQSSVERFGGAYATSYSSSIQLEAMSMLDADMQMAAAMGISLNDYYERFPEERKTPDQLARSAASSVDATFSAFRDAFMEEYQDRARAEEEALYATYESATASSESRAEAQTETGKGIGPWRAVGYGAWAGTNETVYGVLNGIDYYTVQSFKRVSNEMIRLTYTRQEYAEYLRQGIANISDPEEREAAQALWDNSKDIYDVNIIFNEDSFHRDLKTLADNAESTRQYVYENGTEHEIWSFDQTANIVSNLELMAITMMAGSAATAMGVAGTGTAFGITSAVYGLPEGAEYSQRLEAQGARWDMATAAGLGKAAITGAIETAGLKVFTPRPISLMGTTLSESFRNYVSSSIANKYARTFVRSAAHFAVNTVSESMQEYLEQAMGGLYERYATLAATSQEPDEDFWAAANRIADESGAAFWDSLVSSAALSLFGGGADYVMTKRAQNQAMQGVAEDTGQTVSSVEAQLDALMNARAVNDRQQGIEILFDAYAAAEAPAAAQRSVEMAKEYLTAQLTMGAFFNLSDTISRGELGAQMEQAQAVMEHAEGAVKDAEQKVNAARDRWGEAEAALLADPANQQLIQANSMMLDAFVVAKQAVQKVAQEAQTVRAQYETIKAQINTAYSELVEALRTEAVVEAERIVAEERAAQEAAEKAKIAELSALPEGLTGHDSDMFLPAVPTVPVQTAQEAAGGAESLSSSEDGQMLVRPEQAATGALQGTTQGMEQNAEAEGLDLPANAEAISESSVQVKSLETDASQAKTLETGQTPLMQASALSARTGDFIRDVQPYRETGRATDDPQGFAHERIKAKYDASAAAREAQTAQHTQTAQPAQADIQAMQGPAGHPVLQPDQQTAQAGKSGGQEVSNPIQIVRGLARSMGIGTALGARKHVTVPRAVRGYYQQSSRLIWARPGSAMDEAVTMHELGHALSARTGMTATDAMVNALPQAFAEAYRPNELPGEAFAEFVRAYMTDPARAATMAGQQFVDNFEQAMRSAGVDRAVRDARDQLQAFMDATAADRIRSVVIDRSEANKRSGGIREKTRRFITTWLDRTQPAVQFDTAVGANRVNSLQTAARYREHHQGIADRLLNVDFINAFGEIVGESLADRFEGLVRGRDGFQQAVDYQLILHAIDRANVRPAEGANAAQQPGKRVFSDTVATIPELERRAQEMRTANSSLPAASEAMSGWWHDVMQNWMVDTGLMEQGTLDLFESLYPHYVPTNRVFTEEGSGRGGQRKYNLLNAVGSDLEIINPMDQMVANLDRIVKMVADQRVLRTFDDLYQANPGMSMFAHEIPADTEVNRVSRDSVMQALTGAAQAAGTDLNAALGDDVMDAILNALDPYTIEMRRTNTATGPQEVTVVRLDGTRAHYKIDDPLLFQLLANNGPRAAKTGFEIAGRVTRAMTMLTTGANPRFALKNLIRDFQKSVNYGSWAVTYLDGIPRWLRAAVDVATGRGEFRTYRAMGGGGWTRIDTTSESGTGKYRGDLIQGYKSGAARLGEGAAKLVTFEWLNNIIETTSRYVEYRRSKHDKTTEAGRVAAFIDAQEVTVDFRQSGNGQGIRALRQLMPFLNANLQGAYQTARMFARAERDRLAPRLAKTILNNLLMGTLAATLILKYGSDDDREGYALLDEEIKSRNIIFPTSWFAGDGFIAERPFVRLPVSQDALAQAAYAAGVWAAGRVEGETEFSLDMKAVAKSILANMIPDSTILSPLVDVSTNTSWTGSPIVPARLEDEYTTHQSYESTPEAFIALSRALTSMFGQNKLFSPLALKYLTEQYTGFLGQMAIPALSRDSTTGEWSGELALRNVMASWRNSLTIDPAYTNEVTDLYYHNRKLLNQVRSAGKGGLSADMLRPGLPDSDYTQAYEEATEMLARDGLIYNTDQTISDMYKEISTINADPNLSLHAKAIQVREIRMEMVRVLHSANEQLTDYNQRYVERDTMAESFRAMGGNPVIVPLTELEKLPQVFLDDGDAEYMAFVAETYTNDQTSTLPHINRSFSADRVEYEVGDAQWGEFQVVYRDAYRDYMEDPRKGYLPGMTPEERAEVLDKAHNAAWNAAKKWYIDFSG